MQTWCHCYEKGEVFRISLRRVEAHKQNKADASKGLHEGGSIINVASFVAKLGAATPQIACELSDMMPY